MEQIILPIKYFSSPCCACLSCDFSSSQPEPHLQGSGPPRAIFKQRQHHPPTCYKCKLSVPSRSPWGGAGALCVNKPSGAYDAGVQAVKFGNHRIQQAWLVWEAREQLVRGQLLEGLELTLHPEAEQDPKEPWEDL